MIRQSSKATKFARTPTAPSACRYHRRLRPVRPLFGLFCTRTLFWLNLLRIRARPYFTDARRARGPWHAASARWWMASHATAIPSRVGHEHGDTSVMRFQHHTMPCIGRRLQLFAARNPTMPHGPYAGESIFDPMPLHPAPPGLPTTPNGCVDICALITLQTTTKQRTRGSARQTYQQVV
jgi:hypothetical protein